MLLQDCFEHSKFDIIEYFFTNYDVTGKFGSCLPMIA